MVDEHDWVGVQPLNAIAVVISIKPCWKSNAHFEGVTQAKKKQKPQIIPLIYLRCCSSALSGAIIGKVTASLGRVGCSSSDASGLLHTLAPRSPTREPP